MDNRSEIEEKLGVPLGEKGSDRKTTQQAFNEKGLTGLNPTTISRIKGEMTSGTKTNLRLEIAQLLESNNVSAKNNQYRALAQQGMEQRNFNASPYRAQLFKTDHYTEDIAAAIGEKDNAVRQAIRAMRADMTLTEKLSSNKELTEAFRKTAENYISLNLNLPPSMRPPAVILLNENWDHKTIPSFYKNIYAAAGGRALGSWTPFEMEPLSLFYIQQQSSGNHLTPFDSKVLHNYVKAIPTNKFVGEIQADTGIKMDDSVIERHRNVLTYGTLSHESQQS